MTRLVKAENAQAKDVYDFVDYAIAFPVTPALRRSIQDHYGEVVIIESDEETRKVFMEVEFHDIREHLVIPFGFCLEAAEH